MQTNTQQPPFPYLELAIRNCAGAAETYIDLWKLRDEKNIVLIDDEDICDIMNIRKAKFYDDLRKLVKQKLVSIKQKKNQESNFLRIEMTGWDDEYENDD
jgi:transcription initiation factor IIE alpha subunit